ncbi:hypothetical protein J2S54_006875 [Streptomyces sp. DSM 42143]|uniref:hypothetical protein n=1 Tax=Streptomyces sp. DSM 42143 TaxID=2817711 RepID=UPI0027874860|nr:hypothetical protein [Streptomyces sp. DSM 42143]MDQ0390055.1 hypothetical protein [Streptomyces sp. DSM 42143]
MTRTSTVHELLTGPGIVLGVYLDVLHPTGQRLGAVGPVRVGPWNETPVPVMPTELLGQGGITVHAVQANGDGALVFAPDDPAADADQALDDLNIYPDVRIPDPDDGEEQRGSGCQVQPKQYASFQRASCVRALPG